MSVNCSARPHDNGILFCFDVGLLFAVDLIFFFSSSLFTFSRHNIHFICISGVLWCALIVTNWWWFDWKKWFADVIGLAKRIALWPTMNRFVLGRPFTGPFDFSVDYAMATQSAALISFTERTELLTKCQTARIRRKYRKRFESAKIRKENVSPKWPIAFRLYPDDLHKCANRSK